MRKLARLTGAVALIVAALVGVLFVSQSASSAAAPAGFGEGSGFCASATPGGYTLGAYFDDVFACGPPNNSGEGYYVPASGAYMGFFEDQPWGYQCTELADRFLFDIYGLGPIYGDALSGENFASTVHSKYKSVALVVNGTAGQPYVAGDIVSFDDSEIADGHVAVVTKSTEDSSGDGQITVMQENSPIDSQEFTVSGWAIQPSGNLTAVNFDALANGSSMAPTPLVMGEISFSGDFQAKVGIGGSWIDEQGDVKQIAIASDSANGVTIGELDDSGNFWVKSGIGGGWIDEQGDVKQIAIASDSANGVTIGELDDSGNFWVKSGIGGGWIEEQGDVKQIAIASDSANGVTIGELDDSGNFWVKSGIGGGWIEEQGDVKQIAIASDLVNGVTIGELDDSGNFWVKSGIGGGWIEEQGDVKQIAIATDSTNGATIGELDDSGNFWVKSGIGGGWIEEQGDVNAIAINSDSTNGATIGELDDSGNFWAKSGIGGGWIDEQGDVSVISTGAVASASFTRAPTITTQPMSQTVVVNAIATFSAAASGSPNPTVQWQVSTNGGAGFVDISGGKSANYSFSVAPIESGDQYRAVFTNGVGDPATTIAGKLTVFYISSILRVGQRGHAFRQVLTAKGGKAPFTWKVLSTLPKGLKLSSAGLLSGTPSKTLKAGVYSIAVQVADSIGGERFVARVTLKLKLK